MSRSRRAATIAALVLGVLAPLLVAAGGSPAEAAPSGKVRGAVMASGGTATRIRVQWFTKSWTYLGKRTLDGGVYSLRLPPGTYRLQFVDRRPNWDVDKFAPSDVRVTVRAGHTTTRNVQMHRGAAITGTVTADGRPASRARLVAANTARQSFPVQADDRGRFAIGGLPSGSYSVFGYDHGRKWVGKSVWAPDLKRGTSKNVSIAMNTRAGTLLVDLWGGRSPVGATGWLTAVSKRTGQFWTARASGGSVTFAGLYPGRYKLVAPDLGHWFAHTAVVKGGDVRPDRPTFGSFRFTQRSGVLTGAVVDETDDYLLPDALVLLYDASGHEVARSTTDESGEFHLDGLIDTASYTLETGPADGTYLGTEPHRCPYRWTEATVRGHRNTIQDVGVIPMPRDPHQPSNCTD